MIGNLVVTPIFLTSFGFWANTNCMITIPTIVQGGNAKPIGASLGFSSLMPASNPPDISPVGVQNQI